MRGREGFTLIEIVIALGIVAILATIATTNFQLWLNRSSVVGFQREFLSRVNDARTRAMATSLQHRLRIDMNADTVSLERGDLGTGSTSWVGTGATIEASRGAGINDIACVPSPSSAPASCAFVFNPNGEVLIQTDPSADNTIAPLTQASIHLSAQNPSERATIRLFGWTSKARLLDGWI